MNKAIPSEISILPIKNRVLFPGAILRLSIGRTSSVKLIKESVWDVYQRSRRKPLVIGIFTLVSDEEPKEYESSALGETIHVNDLLDDENAQIFSVGTAARVLQLSRSRNSSANFQFSMLVQGLSRIKIAAYCQTEPYWIAQITVLKPQRMDLQVRAAILELRDTAKQLIELVREHDANESLIAKSRELLDAIASSSPGELADILIAHLDLTVVEKQVVLNAIDLPERLELALRLLKHQLDVLSLSSKIQSQVEDRINDSRKEFYLRQQLKAIQEELGEFDQDEAESSLEDRFKQLELPKATEKIVKRDLKRLKSLQPAQPDYHVIRTYLEWIADLPWNTESQDELQVEKVTEQLNLDHHGLEKVKKRIAEYVAVLSLKQDNCGPILCLVGPPGVGKSSLGKSIAMATKREFQRISLGGVHDESEIRGHRRTYVGAMPGSIIHAMKRAGTKNPVLLLDEIDKLDRGGHTGDPSSALLEVLDPVQNSSFTDHYLNTPFDLSKVMFIATANSLDTIPPPLLDRMEVIHVSGYIVEEKLEIAQKYLLPRQIKQNGLTSEALSVPVETLEYLITRYTRESGVRTLERRIGALCRYGAVQVVEHGSDISTFPPLSINIPMLTAIFGPEPYDSEIALRSGCYGVATGLAWTSTGGEILFVEASLMEGSGKLRLTGKLGDVMKESGQLALSWIRSNANKINLVRLPSNSLDVHIHFPAGAVPKDGPSAGVAIVVALLSLFCHKVVPSDIAMTGEITLRGLVLPVGGIKEKVLAAHRGGIRRLLLPCRNRKDVEEDLPLRVRDELDIIYIKSIAQVLEIIFSLQLMREDTSSPVLKSLL